jgi:tryptophan synthase beta subunit
MSRRWIGVSNYLKWKGLIPAIESAHAFAVLDEMKFKEDIVVINLLVVATKI